MTWLTEYTIDIGGARISVGSLLIALAIIAVGFALASQIASKVRGRGDSRANTSRWRGSVAQVTSYAIRLATLSVALQFAGVDIGSLLAASAVIAVGIGIAMQKVAENFVSGVILMAERSIREGDIIEFGDHVARVRNVGIRATIAQTLDDEELIVPNSVLAQSTVKNLTLSDSFYRLRVKVGVSYKSDLEKTFAALGAAAEGITWRDQERTPVVLLVDFGTSSVDFEVSVWTPDAWGQRRGRSDLRRAIWQQLEKAGITIPFPQVDVHVDEEALSRFAGQAGGGSTARVVGSPA